MKHYGCPLMILLAVVGTSVFTGCGGGAAAKPAELHGAQKMRMAQSLMRSGQVGEALAAAEEAIQDDPNNAGLQQFYGEICFSAGLYPQAETAFLRALEIDAFFTEAHAHLGAVYQEMGRLDDAEAHYLMVLANPAYPRPEAAYLGLGLLYARQNRMEEATAKLREAVGVNPKYYTAHYELAGVLERSGELGEALSEYEVAEPGYRASAEFQYRFGFAYMRLGRKIEARERLNRVLSMSPGSPWAEQARELLGMLE